MTVLIADKYGFVEEFYENVNSVGKTKTKARHCVDPRKALFFSSRKEAEEAYSVMEYVGYHCTLALSREG